MFDLINGKVQVDPDLMAYPQLRAIWDRDASEAKTEAFAYMSYMFLYYNPKSSYYKGYPESIRREKIIEEMFPESMSGVKLYEDKEFLQGCKVYNEHMQLSSLRGLLDFAKQIIFDIQKSLMSQKTKTGTKINDLAKLNRAIEELNKTEKMIDEDEKDSRVKGKRQLKDRERTS